ncbi:MAG: hypothetical protein ACI9OJ_002608 [Myxococcota bacterium]|jgi:hypothetical protein
MSDARLILYIPSRPMLVAGRLRFHMEQRGFALMPPGQSAPATGFSLLIRPDGPGCWVHTDVADAIEGEFGQLLSQELRCQVTTIGTAGTVFAYENAFQGVVTEKLAADGNSILESLNSPHEATVKSGSALRDLLAANWISALDMPFEEARGTRRTMTLGFAPRRSQSDETIEIDPLLECPMCQSAMKTTTGPHGTFFGCVRFPDCRGRLTTKQAEAMRAARG